MTELENTAMCFASEVHANHYRRYTGEPYTNHLEQVVELIRPAPGCTPQMLAAAWLHDTVEDCSVSLCQIHDLFGEKVSQYVWDLTSRPIEFGNRAARKLDDRCRLSYAQPEVQTIKLADLISNMSTIVEHDPKFARVYMKEKRDLLVVLDRGDPNLYAMASKIISNYFEGNV